jgi:hypothetical protein
MLFILYFQQGLSRLSSVTKVGNFAQLGGEFVLGPGKSFYEQIRGEKPIDLNG